MIAYIFRRLLLAIPVMLILIVITFVLMYAAPGSPFASERGVPPAVLENLEREYGLDRSFPQQIATYIWNIVSDFDFGPSFQYRDQDVNDLIEQGFPVTLSYGFWSFVVAVLVGGTLGVLAAIKHNSWLDYLAVGISVGAQVLPNFVLAPILVLVFTVWLDVLPGGGWQGGVLNETCARGAELTVNVAGRCLQFDWIILPVIALATSFMASIARIARASMLEVMTSNFIRTARAKGLPMRRIVFSHALKPAMLPVISYLGPAFVGMITGSVVIDIYFSTGGIGQFFVASALNRDYGVMMGITVLLGALTIVFNLVVDILYAWIDPKIRY